MTLQKRVDFARILVAGFAAGAVIAVISWLVYFVIGTYVFPYDVLALEGMRSVDDPLMAVYFLHPWVIGYTMAAVYPFFTKLIQCRTCKPMMFAMMVWLLTAIPQFFLVFTTMDYPVGFYFNQLVGSALYVIAAAHVIWKILE